MAVAVAEKVVALPDLAEAELINQRAAQFIGSIIVGHEAASKVDAIENRFSSLYEAAPEAARGNPEALKLVAANATTEAIEQVAKIGVLKKIEMEYDEAEDDLMQNGQSSKDIGYNAYSLASNNPVIRLRSISEIGNNFWSEHLYKNGDLDDNYIAVASLVVEDELMTRAEMEEACFFTGTMSTSFQLSTANKAKTGVEVEGAFVAGVKAPDAERHDMPTIIKLWGMFGVDVRGKTAAEIIATPLLIPKRLLPNGVVDLVKLYDQMAGGTFFGEDKPVQDYLAYKQACLETQANFEPSVKNIIKDFLREANSFTDASHASHRLKMLAKKHMYKRVVEDASLDSRVYGRQAQPDIEAARMHAALGNTELARAAYDRGFLAAKPTGCAAAFKNADGKGGFVNTAGEKVDQDGNRIDAEMADDTEQSDISSIINCYNCEQPVEASKVIKEKSWCCPKCHYEIDICNGEILNSGNLGKIAPQAAFLDFFELPANVVSLAEKRQANQQTAKAVGFFSLAQAA